MDSVNNIKIKPFDDRDNMSEEFNNFMYRVNEVSDILKKMNSGDMKQQAVATMEADRIINGRQERVLENIDEKDVVLTVKSDRTVINRNALKEEEKKDDNTMSPDAFMAEVSRDADKRYKDRMVRTEKMETCKKQGTAAFRRGEYERAICCYTQALEHIKDSPLVYNNRALTYIKLKMYDKAIADAVMALKFNESCLKSHIFVAKANYLKGDNEGYQKALEEARATNPEQLEFIEDFEKQMLRPKVE